MLKIIKPHHYIFLFVAITCIATLILGGSVLYSYVSYMQHRQNRSITQNEPHAHVKKQTTHETEAPVQPDVHIPPIENGLAPVVTTLPTSQPVVFLGIDDGQHKTDDELKMIKDNNIKASLFLSNLFIRDNPDFFKSYTQAGLLIEDHTLNHDTNMTTNMSYAQQKEEICGMADYEEKEYGRRPVLFRPPGGAYSTTMRKAAADCGMKAIVTWVAKANGGSMQYQYGDHLRPGDVVLMHFRPEFKQDMQAFITATKEQGLHTELIENWLP